MDNNTPVDHTREIELLEKAQDRVLEYVKDTNEKQNEQLEKLGHLGDRLNNMDKILAVQAEQLAVHMKRSDTLENIFIQHKAQADERIKEIEDFTLSSKTTLKVVGIIVSGVIAIAGLVAAIIKIM